MNLAWKSFPHSLYQHLLTTQLCVKPKLHIPLPRTCKRRHTFSEVHGMNLTCLKILKFKSHNDDSTRTPEHHRNIPHLLPVYILPHPHKNSWNREMRRDGGQKEGIRKKMLDYPENMHVLTNLGHIQQACSYIHNTIMATMDWKYVCTLKQLQDLLNKRYIRDLSELRM